MTLLTGYFDESGIHPGDHLTVVAGFVGNDAQWSACIAEWISAIKPRRNLHMKDLRWNQHPDRVKRLLAKLGPIPHKFNLQPVAFSVSWKDYTAATTGIRKSKFLDPYVTCAVGCMGVALFDVVGNDQVCFIFDRQTGLRKEAMEAVRDFAFDLCGADSRIEGADFLKRSATVCLDPADYLAYIIRERGLDLESFKSRAGASIMGSGGHGGRMTQAQVAWMADSWHNPRSPLQILASMKQWNPHFRGPK